MPNAFDASQSLAWLQTVYGNTEGFINIVSTGNWAGRCFRSPEECIPYITQLDASGAKGIYVRITTLAAVPLPDENGYARRGSVEETKEFLGFWADIDIAGPGHKTDRPLPATEADIMAIIAAAGLPEPTEWVHSGGGMYPFWLLDEPLQVASINRAKWVENSANWQRLIELASESLGFSYGAGVGDLARVLRIPGTVNRKVDDNPRPCTWRMDLSESKTYAMSELLAAMNEGLEQLTPVPVVPKLAATPSAPSRFDGGTRPGDAFNAATNWYDLLAADGAILDSDRGGYCEWVRPGKDRRDGTGATTGYMGSDVLKVFTDSWPDLRQGETYDRFGYYAATRHGGNIVDAARALSALGYGEKGTRNVESPQPWTHDSSAVNLRVGDNPLTEDSKEKKATLTPTYSFTESGFVDRMRARHGENLRYVAERKTWLRWNGQVWEKDRIGYVTDLVNTLAQEAWHRANEIEDEKEAAKAHVSLKPMLSNAKQVGATALLGRQLGITVDDLNRHRLKVTTLNGTIDLADYSFTGFQRELLSTQQVDAAYDPTATSPGWDQFLQDIVPSAEMRDYLQRAVGYTLTGDTDRKAIFMIHGPSNCGKSQFLNALEEVFGTLAATTDSSAFSTSDHSHGPNPSLHKLKDARFVSASESGEGMPLNEALVKRITGGDKMSTRTLYAEEETWQPRFTVWIATNHLPRMNSDDNAIWKRVKPIKFETVFGGEREEIYDIGRKLAAAEGPGILNWILEGVRKYRQHGLVEPSELKQGVVDYQADSDPVSRFLEAQVADETLVRHEEERIESKVIYSWFKSWCEEEGIRYPLAANRFGRRMTALGYVNSRDVSGTRRIWKGVGRGAIAGPPVWLAGSRQ